MIETLVKAKVGSILGEINLSFRPESDQQSSDLTQIISG